MTLKTDIADDLGEHHFNTDEFAQTVTYNGSGIPGVVAGSGTEEDANSVYDYLEIELRVSDITTITYRTDTLIYDGDTWRYPKIMEQDAYTLKVRWIRSQRPKAR